MLLLAIFAAQSSLESPQSKVRVQAIATVRIEQPSAVSARQWEQLPKETKSEVIVLDELGRPLLFRLVENQ